MRKKIVGLVCIVLLAVLMPDISTAASLPDGYLQSKELLELFPDMTVEVDFDRSGNGLIYFGSGGDLQLIRKDRLYQGNWKVSEDDRLCTELGDLNWDCRVVVPDNTGYRQYVVKKSGAHRHELTYRKFHSGQQLKNLQRDPLLPQTTLTRRQLEELFSDRSVESVTVKKDRISLTYYAPDGTVEQLRDGKKRFGKWRVTSSDRICLQMENLEEKCRIIVDEDGEYKKYIVKKNGRHQHTVSYRNFIPGNRF